MIYLGEGRKMFFRKYVRENPDFMSTGISFLFESKAERHIMHHERKNAFSFPKGKIRAILRIKNVSFIGDAYTFLSTIDILFNFRSAEER